MFLGTFCMISFMWLGFAFINEINYVAPFSVGTYDYSPNAAVADSQPQQEVGYTFFIFSFMILIYLIGLAFMYMRSLYRKKYGVQDDFDWL